MKRLSELNFGEAFLWFGFACSILFIPDEGLDAITTMGVFAIAAIGVRATRSERNQGDRGNE